jgi:hypothetical protein
MKRHETATVRNIGIDQNGSVKIAITIQER